MTAPGFEVREEGIDASAEFQDAASAHVDQLSVTVREATAQGNLFGAVGQLAGIDATYRSWTEQEATGLHDLGRRIDELGRALRQVSANYRAAEHANDGNFRRVTWEQS
jgi:hypothetical protein